MVTANGNAKHEVSHKFGDSAMYFDGSGDYLSIPDSDDWDFGSEDFTIDFWVNPSTLTGHQGYISNYSSSTGSFYIGKDDTTNRIRIGLRFNDGTSYGIDSSV